ncbi:MAG TPA: hypothetical protein DEP84_02160 [Chloroflexi bacterium]|nr:hypothetical protein [Chloroflexota bacterium]
MPGTQLPMIRLYYVGYGAGDPIVCIHGTSSLAWPGDGGREAGLPRAATGVPSAVLIPSVAD